MKRSWSETEARILDEAFFGEDPDLVASEPDLAHSGYLDSLAIVMIVEVLADMSGNLSVVDGAQQSDFKNFKSIEALYERL